jgi:hypothetical protein
MQAAWHSHDPFDQRGTVSTICNIPDKFAVDFETADGAASALFGRVQGTIMHAPREHER